MALDLTNPHTTLSAAPTIGLVQSSGSARAVEQVRRLTASMFLGEVLVELDRDPEAPDESFWTFYVRASGDCNELLDRQCRWHAEVLELVPEAVDQFRLSIDPT